MMTGFPVHTPIKAIFASIIRYGAEKQNASLQQVTVIITTNYVCSIIPEPYLILTCWIKPTPFLKQKQKNTITSLN